MCYSSVEVFEVCKIVEPDKYGDDSKHSYQYQKCQGSIEDSQKESWSTSNRNQPDNIRWFTNEDALQLARQYAVEKSITYPEKVIGLKSGLQSCSGTLFESDFEEIYNEKGEVVTYTEHHLDDETTFNPQYIHLPSELNEFQLQKIMKRQVIVEEQEKLERQKHTNYWNKIKNLQEPSQKAYEKIKNETNMTRYSFNEKGFLDLYNKQDENSHVNQAYRKGIERGFKKAILYLQKNKEFLNLIQENFIEE